MQSRAYRNTLDGMDEDSADTPADAMDGSS
jgi:cell division protein ZapE